MTTKTFPLRKNTYRKSEDFLMLTRVFSSKLCVEINNTGSLEDKARFLADRNGVLKGERSRLMERQDRVSLHQL